MKQDKPQILDESKVKSPGLYAVRRKGAKKWSGAYFVGSRKSKQVLLDQCGMPHSASGLEYYGPIPVPDNDPYWMPEFVLVSTKGWNK